MFEKRFLVEAEEKYFLVDSTMTRHLAAKHQKILVETTVKIPEIRGWPPPSSGKNHLPELSRTGLGGAPMRQRCFKRKHPYEKFPIREKKKPMRHFRLDKKKPCES